MIVAMLENSWIWADAPVLVLRSTSRSRKYDSRSIAEGKLKVSVKLAFLAANQHHDMTGEKMTKVIKAF